jgi:glycosyltransferase involved in cell wall biosynthesis
MKSQKNQMDALYSRFSPPIHRVYVFPDIEKSSRYNPYLRLLYSDANTDIRSANPLLPAYLLHPKRTAVHYNWLSFSSGAEFFKLSVKLIPLMVFALFGGRIFWTVHNSEPHEQKYRCLNRYIRRVFGHMAAHLCVHTERARITVAHLLSLPREKISVLSHPPYPVESIPLQQARHQLKTLFPNLVLDSEENLFLMYGYIAPYKGSTEIARLFADFPAHRLIIAGGIKDSACYSALKKLSLTKNNIFLLPRFVTPREEQILFSAATHVIFNFTQILFSGSFILAQSYNKKILIRDKDELRDGFDSSVTPFTDTHHLKEILYSL